LQNDLFDLRKQLETSQGKYDQKLNDMFDSMDAKFKYQSKTIGILEEQVKCLKVEKVEVEEYQLFVSKVTLIEKDLNTIKNDDTINNFVKD